MCSLTDPDARGLKKRCEWGCVASEVSMGESALCLSQLLLATVILGFACLGPSSRRFLPLRSCCFHIFVSVLCVCLKIPPPVSYKDIQDYISHPQNNPDDAFFQVPEFNKFFYHIRRNWKKLGVITWTYLLRGYHVTHSSQPSNDTWIPFIVLLLKQKYL